MFSLFDIYSTFFNTKKEEEEGGNTVWHTRHVKIKVHYDTCCTTYIYMHYYAYIHMIHTYNNVADTTCMHTVCIIFKKHKLCTVCIHYSNPTTFGT